MAPLQLLSESQPTESQSHELAKDYGLIATCRDSTGADTHDVDLVG